MDESFFYKTVDNHLKQYFQDSDIFVFDEIYSPDFHLDVYLIKPDSGDRDFYTIMTSGVSCMPMNVPDPAFNPFIELMMLLPKDWPFDSEKWKSPEYYWPIDLIKSLGRFPHSNATWLGFGHSVPEPKDSYLSRNGFCATVLKKASIIDPDFQNIVCENRTVDILMPFPVYPEELKFKKEFGIGSFMENLEKKDAPDIVNLKRPSSIG